MKTVSHSKLSVFQECDMKFQHQYLRKVRSRKRPSYFVFGSACHKFLEVYYTTRKPKLALKMALKLFDEEVKKLKLLLSVEELNNLMIDRAKVEGICQAYPSFYKQDFDEFDTIMTELSFRGDKGLLIGETGSAYRGSSDREPIYYEGDIDGLVMDAAGDWWVLEHKFLAPQTLNDAFISKIHIDRQILGYMWLAKECSGIGVWPKGVIYNVIKKPAIRLKKGETKQAFATRVKNEYLVHGESKEYFQRFDPIISHTHLKQWLEDTKHLAGTIFTRVGIKAKCWPKNSSACTNNYGACLYLPACVTGRYNRLIYEKKKKDEEAKPEEKNSPSKGSGQAKATKKKGKKGGKGKKASR